jgi:tRNA threonylcarbamoyladenosine biosynthesis protein TsaE
MLARRPWSQIILKKLSTRFKVKETCSLLYPRQNGRFFASQSERTICIDCKTMLDLEELGRNLAEVAEVGDAILLDGDLGAGKTSLVRGFIRHLLDDPTMRVTSPSYLLENVYEYAEGMYIHHVDLYRLPTTDQNLGLLGIPPSLQSTDSIYLIEWPQRLGALSSPSSCLKINIEVKFTSNASDDSAKKTSENDFESAANNNVEFRRVKITPVGNVWKAKLRSNPTLSKLLL